ncbi:MAG: hypothetical protein MRERV_16c028 [Mycoplasmataceae bacterium RV_VA103A]|nr:MAG: hypothetical protein MRERV_16c028 [Mycoplasmataceae bacterium RV_VA103A]
MTNFTNIDLSRLPEIPDLKISSRWNSVPAYVWVLETLVDYYLGISNLEGVGWLVDNWWRIERELINKGKIAVVYYGKKFLIADIVEMEVNFLDEITKLKIRFLNDDEVRDWKNEQDKLVIFRNNPQEKGDFSGLANDTQKLDMYSELIRHSLEMTKDILSVKTKGKMGSKAEQHILEGLAKGKLVNIYYEDKRTKQPVDPNSYSYALEGGDWKQREFYWQERDKVLEEIYEKYKIRHINAADKFARTNNPEVYSNLANYWAWEKQRSQVRNNSIREFIEKFPKEGKCRLKYGFIFGAEENEVSAEQSEESKLTEEDKKQQVQKKEELKLAEEIKNK